MRAVLWTSGQSLGQWSAEEVDRIRGEIDGPIVAILDDSDGVAVFQPIDPQTGLAWETVEAAMAFAERYLTPALDSLEES